MFCPFSFGHCVVCRSLFDLQLLITLVVSSICSILHWRIATCIAARSNYLISCARHYLGKSSLFWSNITKRMEFCLHSLVSLFALIKWRRPDIYSLSVFIQNKISIQYADFYQTETLCYLIWITVFAFKYLFN